MYYVKLRKGVVSVHEATVNTDRQISLESIHEAIGGYFEVGMFVFSMGVEPNPMKSEGLAFLVDEEGLLKNLPHTLVRPWDGTPLVGPIMIVPSAPIGSMEYGLYPYKDENEANALAAHFEAFGFRKEV